MYGIDGSFITHALIRHASAKADYDPSMVLAFEIAGIEMDPDFGGWCACGGTLERLVLMSGELLSCEGCGNARLAHRTLSQLVKPPFALPACDRGDCAICQLEKELAAAAAAGTLPFGY